jgi:O-antigen/teichoic acid export membrane protein
MATKPHQWLFTQLLFLRTILFIVSSLILVALHFFTTFEAPFLMLLIIYNFTEAMFCVGDSYYLSQGRTLAIGLRNIMRNALLFLLFVFFAVGTLPTFFHSVHFCIIYVVVVSVTVVAIYFPYAMLNFKTLDISFAKMKSLLQKSWVYGVMDGSSVLYSRSDSLVIQNVLGSAALGFYGSAYRFLDAFNLLPQALFHNLFSLAARENQITKKQLATMLAIMGGAGLLIGGGLFLISEPLITFLLGSEYLPSVAVLQIFSIVVFLFFINSPLHVLIQSSRFLKKYLPFIVGIVIVNLALNLILVNKTQELVTAAWVLVFTQVLTIILDRKSVV